jgi:hypothetical protein
MTEHRAHLGSAAITRDVMEPVRDLVASDTTVVPFAA